MKQTSCKQCKVVLSRSNSKAARIMFIGLSAKPNTEDLCSTTNTGKLVAAIEDRIAGGIGIYRTNTVKCAPLDVYGKLRYPTDREMKSCLPSLVCEIQAIAPKVIVPLGAQVTRFLLQNLGDGTDFPGFDSDFSYQTYSFSFGHFMPIHHPSYIWIYRRKRIDEYIGKVVEQLTELANVH